MISEKFRRQLRQESERWWQEGMIDTATYEQLSQRYQFQTLENEAKNRFIVILMGLGGVLLGLGVITYVAANWQGWPREFRTLLLFTIFIAVNVTGFYLWRRSPSEGGQKLGHSLLLLGALILGANLGLTSQMFHQSGNLYELYLVWSLGVVLMAYGLQLASLGILALILMTIAYRLGISPWIFGVGSGWQGLIEQMPLVVAGVFIPLAYWCRSRVLFGLAAIALTLSLQGNLAIMVGNQPSRWLYALAIALPPALLWGYPGDRWLGSVVRRPNPSLPHPAAETGGPSFQTIAQSLSIVCLSCFAYLTAFHWFWQRSILPDAPLNPAVRPMFLSVAVLTAVAAWGWLKILQTALRHPQRSTLALNSGVIAGCIALPTGVLVLHEFNPMPILVPFFLNLLLFFLALALIRDGLAQNQRYTFWGGMGLLVLGIISRMLEYNTDLLLKALVFALCGVGILLAGVWFERQSKSVQKQPETSYESLP